MKTIARCLFTCLFFIVLSAHAQVSFVNYTTANGLPDNYVLGVALDQSGNRWFATQAGVSMFNNSTWTTYTTAQGLVDNYINCIAVDNSQHVWAGTDVGLCRYNGSTWTVFTTADGLVDNTINYVAPGAGQDVWIGTTGGLSKYDGSGFTNYTNFNGLPSDLIISVAMDSTENMWFGTVLGGLVKFDGNSFTTITTDDSLADNTVNTILIDGQGNKWVGTMSGLSHFGANDQWIENFRVLNGLSSNFVRDLDFDSHHWLWIGYYDDYNFEGGLTMYNGSQFTSWKVVDGLVDNLVKRIAIDEANQVWVATGGGVSKLIPNNLGLEDHSEASVITMFPNPANDFLYLDPDQGIKAPLQIYNAQGSLLYQKQSDGTRITVDLSTWSGGVYLVRYGSVIKKLVITGGL